MARQKTNILERLHRRSPQERGQHEALAKLAARDYLNERYERVSKGSRPTVLYADTTEYYCFGWVLCIMEDISQEVSTFLLGLNIFNKIWS
jgi:hypothetical protein